MITETPERPAAEANLWLQLLDGSHTYPTQTWKLKGKPTIRIGRADDNEVVVVDPSVSRLHVMLNWEEGGWTLVNVGRFGTLVGGQPVGQVRVERDTIIRLGPNGPSLRLLLSGESRDNHHETQEHPVVSIADINESLKRKKVAEIAESDFFRELQKRAKEMRGQDGPAFNSEETV